MPLHSERSADDAGTQYIPPPNANLDPNDRWRTASAPKSNIRSAPLGPSKSAGAQAAEMVQNVLGGLRARAERMAQDRAARDTQRAQERAERETQQVQERTEREHRQASTSVKRVGQRGQRQPVSTHDQSEYLD